MQFRLPFNQFLDVALGGFDEPGLVIARPYVAGQPSAQPEIRALPARHTPWLLAHDVPPQGAHDHAAGVSDQGGTAVITLSSNDVPDHSGRHHSSRMRSAPPELALAFRGQVRRIFAWAGCAGGADIPEATDPAGSRSGRTRHDAVVAPAASGAAGAAVAAEYLRGGPAVLRVAVGLRRNS